MRQFGIGLLLLLTWTWSGAPSAQPLFRLTGSDIDEAIRLGMYGHPQPYPLYHAGNRLPTNENTVVVGAVYTPFSRVAFAVKAAHLEDRTLSLQAIDPDLLRPIAYIAFRWYCCDPLSTAASVDPLAGPQPKIAWASDLASWQRGASRPLWVKPAAEALETFGAQLPYDDVVLVAAFPMDALRPNHVFAIYKDYPPTPDAPLGSRSVRYGQIRAAELSDWR